jgi:hypothetical protein
VIVDEELLTIVALAQHDLVHTLNTAGITARKRLISPFVTSKFADLGDDVLDVRVYLHVVFSK